MPCLRGDADIADTIAEVLKKWDSPYSVEHAIETHTKIVAMNPESIEVVRALRKSGVPAYLATNQHEYRARYMSGVFGYADIFDGEFYSCRLGAKKPDTDYFHAVLKSLPYPARTAFCSLMTEIRMSLLQRALGSMALNMSWARV